MSEKNLMIIIPGVNSESGLTLCRGDLQIYLHSLRLFVTNMPAVVARMRDITENNLKIYRTCAHSLKGMCDYIGAEEIRITAKQLEDMAAAGDLNGILERNENLILQTEKVIGNIQIWLDNNKDYVDRITERNNG